ncbi:MAG TPA: C4-type zinc ribbon domain-containing protein [Candidatus Binataceae bacterium]|nr:C4-type zinc ribbon domain-containing protein [Candidatus Binataceae bacterium]
MREEIARLMDLQVLDRQLQDLELSLADVAGRVEQLRADTEKNQAELQRLTEEDQQVAAARKRIEKELAEGEVRTRNKRMRLNLVRTDKELQAVTHEVDSLKETNQSLEAELAALNEAVGSRTARIKELGEIVAKGRVELKAAEKEIADRVEELTTSISAQRAERDKAAAAIDGAVLARYTMLFARRAGLAVAIVKRVAKDGKCSGCQRLLPPQLYNEIQKPHQVQIRFCPNCQRILFYAAPPPSEE